jgi:hypothetical protein
MADDVALDGQPEDAGQETGEQEQAQPDVAQLLNEIKALRRENAKWRTQLRGVEEAQQAKARAEMTELERLQAELREAQEARTRAEQDRRQVAIRSQVVTAAAKAGFNDPEDAYRMLDASTLDVDDNGTAGGLDVALKDLLKTKPYLAKQATPGTYSPTNPAGGSPQESDQARMARIYGTGGGKSGVFGGSGGGVVWNTKPE